MGDAKPSWQTLASAKREAIMAGIPAQWRVPNLPSREEQPDVTDTYVHQFLSPQEIEITETDSTGIVAKTSTGAWTAVEVTSAFCHRAALAHQLVNCLHEVFFDAALADAKALDDYLAAHGKPMGPLHGLPVSLKDQFHVRGVETTMGYVGWIGTFEGSKEDPRKGSFESEMVGELRGLGAVLYCKTSVPHTLMTGETINNIIEYTWNPRRRDHLASGGSSGGEGALIAMKGSPGGFGTDIGGSIRIPSASCGLFGLRPTTGRLPYEGMANSMDGQNSVLSVVGPLSTSAGGVKLLTQSILAAEPWLGDPLVVEMPWRGDLEKETKSLIASKGLAFGVLGHDGIVGPHPPVTRAVAMVRKLLLAAGASVIDWQPPEGLHRDMIEFVGKTWTYDGGEDARGAFGLSGEPCAPQVADVAAKGKQANATEIAANNVALRRGRKKYLDFWNSTAALAGTGRPVDALVMPVAPFTAPRRERFHYYGYTTVINGLDYPSVVVPVTTADKTLDVVKGDYKPLSDLDKEVQGDYDPDVYHGAPVCVQIVGRRYQEERLLAIAEWLEGEMKKSP